MKGEVSEKKVAERVYDYITEYGRGSALEIRQGLGLDMKTVRAALGSLGKEGRITKYFTIPQQPRIIPKREASSNASITTLKEVRQMSLHPPKPAPQIEASPTPPRIIPTHIPESVSRKLLKEIGNARAAQQSAKYRQREIKKKSRLT